jgi:glycosyltransferase involved in cell wall biosynthesis
MKIVVAGTRGIPFVQGGIETHCEELYPLINALGYEVIVLRRSCYVKARPRTEYYKGLKLVTLYSPHNKSLEAIVHTFISVIWAKIHNAAIIHIHGIGPAIMIPMARILGLKVVFTHHGPDYERRKWGWLARFALRFGEFLGVKFANEVIVISDVINRLIITKFERNNAHLIFNGVPDPNWAHGFDFLEKLGISPKNYILAIGRFVEEKGFDLLINAFISMDLKNSKLVIAGDADHKSRYSKRLKDLGRLNSVIMPGFVKGNELAQLYTNARLFVLPSYHEGLPIALLEAMSYRIPVVVSDIPANRLAEISGDSFFKCGDVESLREIVNNKVCSDIAHVDYNMHNYRWNRISEQTSNVYNSILTQ